MGFVRFFSTCMRDEKVRIFRALGPVRASAAFKAMGRRIDWSSCLEAAVSGAVASREAYRAWSLGGSCFVGNDVSWFDLVSAASSFP